MDLEKSVRLSMIQLGLDTVEDTVEDTIFLKSENGLMVLFIPKDVPLVEKVIDNESYIILLVEKPELQTTELQELRVIKSTPQVIRSPILSEGKEYE